MFDRVIFQCIIGSQAYGLADGESDIDRRGFYLPPAALHWSLYGVPEQLECHETQEAYWEIQKFLVLALKANPNVLECLYSPLVETGIHLLRAGEVEANLVSLDETFKLSYISDLVERKVSGTEKGTLDQADLEFHQREYERLRTELQQAFEQSRLPDVPSGVSALNALLVRIRLASLRKE